MYIYIYACRHVSWRCDSAGDRAVTVRLLLGRRNQQAWLCTFREEYMYLYVVWRTYHPFSACPPPSHTHPYSVNCAYMCSVCIQYISLYLHTALVALRGHNALILSHPLLSPNHLPPLYHPSPISFFVRSSDSVSAALSTIYSCAHIGVEIIVMYNILSLIKGMRLCLIDEHFFILITGKKNKFFPPITVLFYSFNLYIKIYNYYSRLT